MVRDFIKNNKLSRTNYKATADVRVGMGVVLNHADMTFGLPTAETADNIFVVAKERIPYGVDAARTDFSDYDEIFQTVAKGDCGKLVQFEAGDAFGVDEVSTTAAPVVGDMVSVGVDGKWQKATVASRYQYVKDYNDNGHTLKYIVVLETPVTK